MRVLTALLMLAFASSAGATPSRRVAFTFDDLPGVGMPCDIVDTERLNRKLVDALKRERIAATGLVVDGNLCSGQRQQLSQLYQIWLEAGLELGNHSYSHRDLNTTPLDEYQADVLAGETTLRPLLEARGTRLRYFRYPFLRSGTELPKKRAFERFLREHGYTNAPVTIDNDEYIYATIYERAVRKTDKKLAARVADEYIRYMRSIFVFYEKLSRDTLGYELPQILLLHMNRLNADHLGRLARMVRQRGYTFISMEEALRDKAYAHADSYVGRRGLSWLQRWALEDGKPAPAQPEVARWVMNLYRAR